MVVLRAVVRFLRVDVVRFWVPPRVDLLRALAVRRPFVLLEVVLVFFFAIAQMFRKYRRIIAWLRRVVSQCAMILVDETIFTTRTCLFSI